MDALKKKLSGQYRSGCRWLVYDTRMSNGWLDRVSCFAGYSGAAAFCRARSGREGIYRIRVLSDTLAGLNGVRAVEATSAERLRLQEQLAVRPLMGYSKVVSVETGLLRQKYFPVFWNRWRDPLSVVSSYQVISGGGERKKRARVLGSYGGFPRAVAAFIAAVREAPAWSRELLLIGTMYGYAEVREGEDIPENGVIVFYRSGPGVTGNARGSVDGIEQLHDPVQPVQEQTPYFASYDRRQGVLRFFDELLKGARPGEGGARMELEYFDFEGNEIFDRQAVL
jgi:hypothetical protein